MKRISKHYLFHFFPGPLRNRRSIPEVHMPFTVVLAVGLDSSLVAGQRLAWQSSGQFDTPVKSIKEAIVHLREGDFDLVLLGHSISPDSRERFTPLIRESGSCTPVVSITDSPKGCDSFADNDQERSRQPAQEYSGINGRARQSTCAESGSVCYCSIIDSRTAFSTPRWELQSYQSTANNCSI
jgi:hypothetical protein